MIGLGLTIGLVLGLAVLSSKWPIAGVGVISGGIVLADIRILVPTRLRDEFWPWVAALLALAAIAAAVAAVIPH